MDIRQFFTPPSKKKVSSLHDNDEVISIKKKSSKRKGVLFDSDTSDEDPIPKNVRKELNTSDVIANSDEEDFKAKGTQLNQRRKKSKKTKVVLKETTPSEFFGNFKPTSKSRSQKRKAPDDDIKTSKVVKKSEEKIIVLDDLDEIVPKPKLETAEKEIKKPIKTVSKKLKNVVSTHKESTSCESDNLSNVSKMDKTEKSKAKNETTVSNTKKSARNETTLSNNRKSTKNETTVSDTRKLAKNEQSKTIKQKTPPKLNKNEVVKTPEKQSATTDTADPASTKKSRFLQYHSWQNRSGPSAPGSKEVPEGNDFCFETMVFVITGVQESLTRDEIKSLIERYGGKVTTSVSSRTTYLITGNEPGESKLKKAEQHKTKVIDEDEFLDLIRTLPAKRSKYDVQSEVVTQKTKSVAVKQKRNGFESKTSALSDHTEDESSQSSKDSASLSSQNETDVNLMWVDKYKPKAVKQIIGQQGANSNMNKLMKWLQNWHTNHRTAGGKSKPKPKVSMWGNSDPSGASFKAALLSGPPGIGKTTTATLVCKELGFSYVELNASDQRSKRTLQEDVAASVQNTSISILMRPESRNSSGKEGKHVLIMDEVDGMAGNEDRGGMQELIQIIKQTKIPIICMCNDRSSPKIRSLSFHCFDLRFNRPTVEQITGAVMSICYKEGIKVQSPAVQAIIRGCNQDIRQVLHNLNMIKATNASLSYDDAKSHADATHKDANLGLFEIAKKLLSSETSSLSITDKSNLFFMDYSMMPLFVQENYVNIVSSANAGNVHQRLDQLSKAADSIAEGDLVDAVMRHDQSWSMLPTLGLLSTVIPCEYMRGSLRAMINFPAFFGKLSTTGKNKRLLQDLKFHSSVNTNGCSRETFNLDLVPYLRWHLATPLVRQSKTGNVEVPKVTKLLDDYDLTREDFDSLMEIGMYTGRSNFISQVDSKVKAAFTRTYNKESHLIPYAVDTSAAVKKKRKASPAEAEGLNEDDSSLIDDVGSDEEDDDVGKDGMIKVQAKKKPQTKTSKKNSNNSSKRSKKK